MNDQKKKKMQQTYMPILKKTTTDELLWKGYLSRHFTDGLVWVAVPCALWQKEKTFFPGTADVI